MTAQHAQRQGATAGREHRGLARARPARARTSTATWVSSWTSAASTAAADPLGVPLGGLPGQGRDPRLPPQRDAGQPGPHGGRVGRARGARTAAAAPRLRPADPGPAGDLPAGLTTTPQRGAIRMAPSRRIVLAVEHRVGDDVRDQRGVLVRARRAGSGAAPAGPSDVLRLLRQPGQHRRLEQARRDRHHPDQRCRRARGRSAGSCRRRRPWTPSRRPGRSGRRTRRPRRC